MRCLFDSPATACKQIKGLGAISSITCRPYHQRQADTTRWFVIPGSDWPPFPYGKYFADWDPDDEGALRIGAMVEKGLGSTTAPLLKKVAAKGLLMKRGWYWREIIEENNSELLVESILEAASRVGGDLHLEVRGARVNREVGGDPYDGRQPLDRVTYKVDKSGSLEVVHSELTEDAETAPLGGQTDIDGIAAALRELSAEDWMWIGVFSWMSLDSSQKKAKKGDDVITINELWETLLQPFVPWLAVEDDD